MDPLKYVSGVCCVCVLKCDIHDARTPNATNLISSALDALSLSRPHSKHRAETVIVNSIYKRTERKKTNYHINIINRFEIFMRIFLNVNSFTHHIATQLHRIVLHCMVANQFRMKINCATPCNVTSTNDCMNELQLSFIVHLSSIFTAQNCFGLFFWLASVQC